jgi:hypothetical protein
VFNSIITELFRERYGSSHFTDLALALEQGDGQLFEKLVGKFMVMSMSFYDVPSSTPQASALNVQKNDPEGSYHLFVLGLLVIFSNRYAVRSNRESGYGRYDIMLIPHDKTKRGIVIEFKKKDEKETLKKCAERALEQIRAKDYATELRSHGVEHITFFGIGCHQKKILLQQA